MAGIEFLMSKLKMNQNLRESVEECEADVYLILVEYWLINRIRKGGSRALTPNTQQFLGIRYSTAGDGGR